MVDEGRSAGGICSSRDWRDVKWHTVYCVGCKSQPTLLFKEGKSKGKENTKLWLWCLATLLYHSLQCLFESFMAPPSPDICSISYIHHNGKWQELWRNLDRYITDLRKFHCDLRTFTWSCYPFDDCRVCKVESLMMKIQTPVERILWSEASLKWLPN